MSDAAPAAFPCKTDGGTRINGDDMQAMGEIFRKVVCCGMQGPLKALLDRTIPLSSMAMQETSRRQTRRTDGLHHLKYLMICSCGFPNRKHDVEPAAAPFRLSFPGSSLCPKAPCSSHRRPCGEHCIWWENNTRASAKSTRHCSEIGASILLEEQYTAIAKNGG